MKKKKEELLIRFLEFSLEMRTVFLYEEQTQEIITYYKIENS